MAIHDLVVQTFYIIISLVTVPWSQNLIGADAVLTTRLLCC